MINNRSINCKSKIDQLRNELHGLIESENLTSTVVQKRSRELDELILLYYRQNKRNSQLKEP